MPKENISKYLNDITKHPQYSDAQRRKSLEKSFRQPSATRSTPLNSTATVSLKGVYNRAVNTVKSLGQGTKISTSKAANQLKKAAQNSTRSTPRPAVPGAGIASGIATLGIGVLFDRYVSPYSINAAERAGGYLGANLAYKRGKISEFELAAALDTIRNGNPRDWGNRISQIRKLQEAAKKGKKKLSTQQTESRNFTGGQSDGVLYYVGLEAGSNGQVAVTDIKQCFGSIGGARMRQTGGGGYIAEILCRGIFLGGVQNTGIPIVYDWYSIGGGGTGSADIVAFMNVTHVNRVDGQPEVVEQQTKTSIPIVPSVVRQPINFPTPRTTDKPPEENKAKPSILIIPSGFPISVSGGNGSTTITPPTTKPSQIEIPHPRTIPPDPNEEKKVPPLTISNPNSPNIKLETSGSGPVTINIPGYNPITVNPGTNKPQGALPIQDVQRQYQPVASTATPTKPGTTPTAPTSPTTTKPATTEDLDQFKKDLEKLILTGGLLAGLTPAIQAIGDRVNQTARQTTPEALETAAAAGTCRTTQPGGCTTKALDDAVGRVNQNSNNNANALDAANALANAKQLEQLGIINNKLGAQLPGGIGGALSRFVNWAVVDRITNIITMFAALHNVMMLSNSVKETFLDVLDNLLQTGYNIAPTIFKQADSDSAIDAREYIGGAINTFFGKLFGVAEWTALKAQWKAYSTIYSSSAQAYNNLRELHNDSQQLLNMARNYTAELGNALVDEGVISEDNWEQKDANKIIKSKMLGKLERMGRGLEELDNKLEAIEQVTSLLLNITNTAKEIKENIEAIDKGVKDANEAAKKVRIQVKDS